MHDPSSALTVETKIDDTDADTDSTGDQASEDGVQSIATGSFVKVDKNSINLEEADQLDDSQSDPDFFKTDPVAWDLRCSPLHLAIYGGHCDVVKMLCQDFGADVLLPIKLGDGASGNTYRAFLSLVIPLVLPIEKAIQMTETLLSLGATSSQTDTDGITAFHRYVRIGGLRLIETLCKNEKTGLKAALNHASVVWPGFLPETTSPLMTAIDRGDPTIILKLLEAGAHPDLDFDTWLKSAKLTISRRLYTYEENKETWTHRVS